MASLLLLPAVPAAVGEAASTAPGMGLGMVAAAVGAVLAMAVAGLLWRRRQRAGVAGAAVGAADVSATSIGLASRAHFEKALDAATRPESPNAATQLAVLFVNIDNFRAVNETMGLAAGNEVLRLLGERLLALLDAEPMAIQPLAMRMGADEYVIGVPVGLEAACELARRIGRALHEPLRVQGTSESLQLASSIGISVFPDHGFGTRLISHAAQAMQSVKRAGGADWMVFEPQMAVDMRAQAEMLMDLRNAVQRGELELWYQPKVNAKTLQITAAEALLRWRHPRRGMVSPGLFIPIAERSGLIGQIGNWVIDEATRQAAVWRSQGLHMRVAINLSAYQMRQDDLVDRIEEALGRHKLSPHRFTVEITESVAMEDTQVTQRSFERMRKAGLHVSIDDFGVGQASLSYLRKLPAAELKIDASFVKDVAVIEDAKAIVDAVVKLAHALSLKVVAEGVETPAQRDRLIELGCDELQGYLFAKPMTARALATWAQMDTDAPAGEGSDDDRMFRPSLFEDSVGAAL